MDELKIVLHWITTDYAGNLKQLHVKTAGASKTSMSSSIYADSDQYADVQHICNLLKATVLASYPQAQIENWYNGEKDNGEIIPESYRKIIPGLKELFASINSD